MGCGPSVGVGAGTAATVVANKVTSSTSSALFPDTNTHVTSPRGCTTSRARAAQEVLILRPEPEVRQRRAARSATHTNCAACTNSAHANTNTDSAHTAAARWGGPRRGGEAGEGSEDVRGHFHFRTTSSTAHVQGPRMTHGTVCGRCQHRRWWHVAHDCRRGRRRLLVLPVQATRHKLLAMRVERCRCTG